MVIGNKDFDTKNHTYVMGILNVTPDSFSDGGLHAAKDAALKRAAEMVKEGAHIIDIGGESTRPGAEFVPEELELERVIPVIERIKSEFDIPVSLDTYKPTVASEGIKAGADLINDIWGLLYDPLMGKVISESKVSCVLMHNRKSHDYVSFGLDFVNDCAEILERAFKAGISEDRIILDPGIGFAKTYEENLWVLNNMDLLNNLGAPWLLGCSRKSVIGNTLNLPTDERLEGTLATTALAVMKGASFVRVHDIKENKRVIDMLEAVKNEGKA